MAGRHSLGSTSVQAADENSFSDDFVPVSLDATGQSFGARLREAISRRGPLCVGIDPHPDLLRAWNLETNPKGLAIFCNICVEAFEGFAAVKPQVAFFEAYGSEGYAVLEQTISRLRKAQVLVVADAKRGDIGSTMEAYAEAWVGGSPLAADAVTASPYLGFESLRPLLDRAIMNNRGVFVLAATSNPEGATVQSAEIDGKTVAQSIIDRAAEFNSNAVDGTGSVGVVVGATLEEEPNVSNLNGPVLVPGLGAQGGKPETLKELGSAAPGRVLPVVAREVLKAGPAVSALREAGERILDSLSYLQNLA